MEQKTLRIALENVDFRLPTQVTDDNSVTALKSLVLEPLLRWQPGGYVKPGLFSEWDHSPDGTIWDFKIRDGASFHSGTICTAPDVVTYINGLLNSRDYFDMPWSYSRYFAHATITAEDDRTVRIVNPKPFADVLDILCEFWPVRFAADGKPVDGTGPYKVVEFEREAGIGRATLQRVDTSRSNEPHVIVAKHEPNGNQRLQLLQDGDVDVALNLERSDNLNSIDFDPALHWGRLTSTLSAMFYLNCTKGVFQSQDARLAANLAIDKGKLVETVFQGLALPSATIVSPFHLGSAEASLKPITFDPVAARSLLEKVDLSNPIVLRTPTYMPEHAEKIAKFVASSLEAVGFKIEIHVETNRPEYARSIGIRKNIGDLALFDSTPNSTFRVLDDKISSASRNTWWLGYHDDEMQDLIQAARDQIDDVGRRAAYAKCLKRAQVNPPWLYIAHPDVVWASRPGVEISIGRSGILTLA
jgi:peptide/nickel transport system substrate-binding protein